MAKNKFDSLFAGREDDVLESSAPSLIEKGEEYMSISLDRIDLHDKNDYSKDDTDEDIELLADDIERNSLMHNIVVMQKDGGRYVILSGERRYKAYLLLRERHKGELENPYGDIYCRVFVGLDELEQTLYIDAANLNVRGASMSDERAIRKGFMRFIEGLKAKYGCDDKQALGLAKKYSGVSRQLISKNMLLETGLLPELLEYLDNGKIDKKDALLFAKLSTETQSFVLSALKNGEHTGEFDETVEKVAESSSNIVRLQEKKEARLEEARTAEAPSEKKRLYRDSSNIKQEIEAEQKAIESLASEPPVEKPERVFSCEEAHGEDMRLDNANEEDDCDVASEASNKLPVSKNTSKGKMLLKRFSAFERAAIAAVDAFESFDEEVSDEIANKISEQLNHIQKLVKPVVNNLGSKQK